MSFYQELDSIGFAIQEDTDIDAAHVPKKYSLQIAEDEHVALAASVQMSTYRSTSSDTTLCMSRPSYEFSISHTAIAVARCESVLLVLIYRPPR